MDDNKTIALIIALLTCFTLGYTTSYYTTPEKIQVETIKIPEVVIEKEIMQVPVVVYEPYQVNHTVVVKEYELIETVSPTPLRNFPNKATLLNFIRQDDTNDLPYTDRWTCFDFTIRTIENAELQGYRVYFFYRNNADGTAHAMCMAYVVEEAQYVIWEPQTDMVQFTWGSNVAGTPTWVVP